MPNIPSIDGLILAGGAGRRLHGRDKGLLSHDQGPFAEVLVRLLRPYCRQVLISCNRNLEQYRRFGDRVLNDIRPGRPGPLAGIESAALVSNADFLLVTPCDTPALDPRFPQRMLAGLHPSAGPRMAQDDQRPQFLHLVLPRAQALGLGTYLNQGGRSVQEWLLPLNPLPVDFSDCPELFHNINTPQDLQAWQDRAMTCGHEER